MKRVIYCDLDVGRGLNRLCLLSDPIHLFVIVFQLNSCHQCHSMSLFCPVYHISEITLTKVRVISFKITLTKVTMRVLKSHEPNPGDNFKISLSKVSVIILKIT